MRNLFTSIKATVERRGCLGCLFNCFYKRFNIELITEPKTYFLANHLMCTTVASSFTFDEGFDGLIGCLAVCLYYAGSYCRVFRVAMNVEAKVCRSNCSFGG